MPFLHQEWIIFDIISFINTCVASLYFSMQNIVNLVTEMSSCPRHSSTPEDNPHLRSIYMYVLCPHLSAGWRLENDLGSCAGGITTPCITLARARSTLLVNFLLQCPPRWFGSVPFRKVSIADVNSWGVTGVTFITTTWPTMMTLGCH